jgi:hypothetical protein
MGMRMRERTVRKGCSDGGRERVMNGGECKTAAVVVGTEIVDIW